MSVTPHVTEVDFPCASGFHLTPLVDLFQSSSWGFFRLRQGKLWEVTPPGLHYEQVPRASSGEEGLLALKHMEDHPLKHILTWFLHRHRPLERRCTHGCSSVLWSPHWALTQAFGAFGWCRLERNFNSIDDSLVLLNRMIYSQDLWEKTVGISFFNGGSAYTVPTWSGQLMHFAVCVHACSPHPDQGRECFLVPRGSLLPLPSLIFRLPLTEVALVSTPVM